MEESPGDEQELSVAGELDIARSPTTCVAEPPGGESRPERRGQELESGRAHGEAMWKELQKHEAFNAHEASIHAMGCPADAYDQDCGLCTTAKGIQRKHQRVKDKSEWVLSADLSGPQPETVGTKYRYLVVSVIRTNEGQSPMPFV